MALRSKKDIKKSSYYVWFLGAQESRGLRGEEFALPAIEHLERRSKDLEPFKVTLQVSHKGLKIVQNVAPKGKQQTIKHFIPHGSITSAVVQGDVVACVLLLFNPVTKCPIHVHAYRCDSDNTAEMLCTHLQALIDRPENQKKFADIERKLQIKGALPQAKNKVLDSSLGSEVSTRESESGSSEERCVATLYDSLAAELKQKLSTGKSPILLPPRDYDTVHRQRGNLSGIETRRCLNQSIVGVNARRKLESSGGSSGIGSDLAPSPDRNEYPRQHDNQSTSEEDWAESTAYLMHEGFDVTPPQRALSPRRDIHHSSKYPEERMYRQESLETPNKYAEEFAYQRRYTQRQQSPLPTEQLRHSNKNSVSIDRVQKETTKFEKVPTRNYESRKNNYGSNAPKLTRGMSEGSLKLADGSISPKDRFNVAKEKFMNLERERFNQELEKHMRIRRSMLEKNLRASSPEEFKNNSESRKWSREEDEDEVVLERRAELPRVGQRYPSRDNAQNGVDKRYYEYGRDEHYEQRSPAGADRRRLAVEDVENERFYNRNNFAELDKDYRQSRRFDNSDDIRRNELDRRIEEDFEVRDTRIEPVIEDRKKRNADPKRLSRIDAVRDDRDRYEAKPAKTENRRGAAPEDEWSNHRRPVSRSRLLREPNKRQSAYDAEVEARRTFEMRKSYAEVNNNGFSNTTRNYERYGHGNDLALDAGREPQLRYREEVERRDRYSAPGLDSAKLRHSYAEPMIRNRVGIAPVRPY